MKVEVKTYKCGDYKPNGSLDYKLYLQECKVFESDDAEKMLFEIAIAGEENLSPDELVNKILWAIGNSAFIEASKLYDSKLVNSFCDLVVIEICHPNGYVFVRGSNFSPMAVIYRNKTINYDDMLSFKDNTRAVLAWDNYKWYDPKKPDPRFEEKQMS